MEAFRYLPLSLQNHDFPLIWGPATGSGSHFVCLFPFSGALHSSHANLLRLLPSPLPVPVDVSICLNPQNAFPWGPHKPQVKKSK